MSESVLTTARELAFHFPKPIWSRGDWIKNLVLFFDGIALLVPGYMKRRPEEIDPAIVSGLRKHHLLQIIKPEKAVDKAATERLATALTDIIASGVLDSLATKKTAFHELSMSRLGYYGDPGLAKMIFDELKQRGLAKDSKDHVSIPLHPKVRSLVLVLLSQILKPYGKTINANLNPANDMTKLVRALSELIAIKSDVSSGHVVQFDLNTVTVDLASIPIEEVLDFLTQNLEAHLRYMLSVRKNSRWSFHACRRTSSRCIDLRQAELNNLASDLRKRARKARKKPASFALTLVGSAASALTSPIASALRVGAAATGYQKNAGIDTGAYSYLFNSGDRFGYY